MPQIYPQTLKADLVKLYTEGMKVSSICNEYSIPRSTMYFWLNKNKVIKKIGSDSFTARDVYLLQKKMKMIEIEYSILKECGCNLTSPRKERLEAIIKKEDSIYKPVIKCIFEETKGRLGAKKIRVLMENSGFSISACRISRLMNEMDLVCISRRKKTQYNFSPAMKYRKNVLKRNFRTDQPNKVWVSDITTINLNFKPYYLCAVIDLFSRKVIAYRISKTQDADLVLRTFNDALKLRNPNNGLIFHSDQGSQYTSFEFRKHLRELGVVQSFSEPGCPYDNAVAESFFKTFKAKKEVYQNY